MERLDVHAVNTPSRQVGGDYYDVVSPAGGGRLVAIADVSGKGVPAALLTSMLQASLRTQAENTVSVGEILTGINALVYRSTSAEQFATFFLARVDEENLRMTYCNAGHNYPVLIRSNGEHEYLVRGGMMVGSFAGASFEEGEVQLAPGDRVVLYTDGISEAVNRAGQEFGEDRVRDLVRRLPPDLSAREITSRILDAFYRFLDGAEPQDDVTVMVLRVLEPAPAPTAGDEETVAAEMG
jgi:sigma-B regulation protein RsbU (phosphoserine phosphatase)